LESKLGAVVAVLLTSLVFTAWHYGAIPNNLFAFGQVFIISILIGLIYAATKSFILVVSLHAIYDALWSFTPVYTDIVNINWGFVPLITALMITIGLFYNFKRR